MRSSPESRKILLDTSFLLPTLGIRVQEEVNDALQKLHPRTEKIFYSEASLLECIWLAKGLIRKGKYDEAIFRRGLLSITKTGYYDVLHPSAEDYLFALRLCELGHTDMIDNLLYAIALNNMCWFLTIDETFETFIEKQDFQNVILTPKTL